MGYREMDVVWDKSQANRVDKLLLLAIARRYSVSKGAWPSQKYLAKVCGMSERNVRASLKRLHDLGELVWDAGNSGGKANSYRITLFEQDTKIAGVSAKTSAKSAKTSAENDKNFRPLNNILNQLDISIYLMKVDFEFDLTPESRFWDAMREQKDLLGLSGDEVLSCLDRFKEHPNYKLTNDRRLQADRFLNVWLPNELLKVRGVPQERQGYSIAEGDK